MKRTKPEKCTHISGYTYYSDCEEEFLETMNSFASALLKSHRTGVKIPRPPYIMDGLWQHNLYCKLWRDYYSGATEWVYEIDEESIPLMKDIASTKSLQRLVTKEV